MALPRCSSQWNQATSQMMTVRNNWRGIESRQDKLPEETQAISQMVTLPKFSPRGHLILGLYFGVPLVQINLEHYFKSRLCAVSATEKTNMSSGTCDSGGRATLEL